MNPIERVDALDRLMKIQADRFDKRRNIEWNVTIGLWAVLVGCVTLAQKVGINPSHYWLFGGAIFLVHSVLWVPGLRKANESDKQIWMHYAHEIESIVVTPEHQVKRFDFNRLKSLSNWDVVKDWSQMSQTLTLWLLFFLVGAVVQFTKK